MKTTRKDGKAMIIIPAINIKDGKCVRLFKGDFETAQTVAESAEETALEFEKKGAKLIHMVDLDGAKDAKVSANFSLFKSVREKVKTRLELGGGIRTMETVDEYFSLGFNRLVLGSVAVKNPELLKKVADKYSDKIVAGIDALNGIVRTEGWLFNSHIEYLELAKRMEDMGVKNIVYTDIGRDGTQSGCNLDELFKINEAVSCNIIASGGVSSLEDLKQLNDLGLYGAIVGKAIYSGAVDLEEAIKMFE